MPNRIIKESICTSEEVDRLSAFQETFFYRLIVNCDDYGRLDARARILKSKLFPLKDIRADQIEEALRALASAKLVILYEIDGKPFLQMRTWDRHQRVRAKVSRYPAPADNGGQAPTGDGEGQQTSPCGDGRAQTAAHDSEPPTDGEEAAADSRCHLTAHDSETPTGADICARNPIQSNPESESNPESNPESESNPEAEARAHAEAADSRGQMTAHDSETPTSAGRAPQDADGKTQPEPPVTDDPVLGELLSFYMKRFNGYPSPMCICGLRDYAASLGKEVVMHAMEIAVGDKKLSWSYLRGILNRYQREGLTSMDAVLLSEQQFENSKARRGRKKAETPQRGLVDLGAPIESVGPYGGRPVLVKGW